MSNWVLMIMSSKRHLKNWVVKCGQRWEKNLPGTKMENWPIGKWVGGSSLLLFPQHHSQRCVQWAYSRRNCTTEKWRRSETRAERNALSAAWPCGCNMHEPGGLPDLFQARTPAFRVQPATIRNKKWPRWPRPGERGNPRYYLPRPSWSRNYPPSQEVFDNATCSAPRKGGRKGKKKKEKGRKIWADLDAVFHPSRDAANKRQRQRGSSSEREEEEKSKRLAVHAASTTEKNAATANQEMEEGSGTETG